MGYEDRDTDANLYALKCLLAIKGQDAAIDLLDVMAKEYKFGNKTMPRQLSEFGVEVCLMKYFFIFEKCNLKINEKNLHVN
jgi:hypothetical protein